MQARSLVALVAPFALSLVLASPALAGDNGEGLLGETDDKIITLFGLGLALFFALVVAIGTIIQSKLEKRQEKKKAARMRGRIGW